MTCKTFTTVSAVCFSLLLACLPSGAAVKESAQDSAILIRLRVYYPKFLTTDDKISRSESDASVLMEPDPTDTGSLGSLSALFIDVTDEEACEAYEGQWTTLPNAASAAGRKGVCFPSEQTCKEYGGTWKAFKVHDRKMMACHMAVRNDRFTESEYIDRKGCLERNGEVIEISEFEGCPFGIYGPTSIARIEEEGGTYFCCEILPNAFEVEKVVDCRTIQLTNGERVRLAGVDCSDKPEIKKEKLESALYTYCVKRRGRNPIVILEYDSGKRDREGSVPAVVYTRACKTCSYDSDICVGRYQYYSVNAVLNAKE